MPTETEVRSIYELQAREHRKQAEAMRLRAVQHEQAASELESFLTKGTWLSGDNDGA